MTGDIMDTSRPNLVATRFFLTIYGFQTFPNWFRTAHTFAIVVKKLTYDDGTASEDSSIISWLPDSGIIQLIGTETGRNYTLQETLDFKDPDASICSTPTEEVSEEFYNSFLERKHELESGTVKYIMNDRFSTRPHDATNCIHAVSDLPIALKALPMLDTGTLHGCSASFAVYNYFQPWFVSRPDTRDAHLTAHPIPSLPGAEILDEEKLAALQQRYFQQEEAIAELMNALRWLTAHEL